MIFILKIIVHQLSVKKHNFLQPMGIIHKKDSLHKNNPVIFHISSMRLKTTMEMKQINGGSKKNFQTILRKRLANLTVKLGLLYIKRVLENW